MTVENANFIHQLDATLPAASDFISEGDDHFRTLKSAVKATFPNVTGAVTPTHTELNTVAGATSGLQAQINTKATKSGETYTGTHHFGGAAGVFLPSNTEIGSVLGGEIAHLSGVTSAIQGQIDGKASTLHAHPLADVTGLQVALDGKQQALVSGENIKTINGNGLLGAGNLVIAGGGASTWDSITDKPATFPPSEHDHSIASVTGLTAALAGKADNSVALTDAAATATLPATTAEPVASRLQALRNNVKQAFADLGTKLNTDFTSLTTRTIDGTETLALSGGLKATVQAVLNWILGRANTWTGNQTFNTGISTGDARLKIKRVTVTAGASGTTSAAVSHGLSRADIVAFAATVNGTSFTNGPNYTSNASILFDAVIDASACNIFYHASAATGIYGRSVSFVIFHL